MCNSFVDFLLRVDKRGVFRMGALQSDEGQALLKMHQIDLADLSSVVLIHPKGWYKESRAVLEIARKLPWPWPFLYVFLIIPPFLRNWLYRQVALKRYNMFGKREVCRLPNPEEQARFI